MTTFKIAPIGYITGGYFQYSMDPSGLITYWGEIDLSILFLPIKKVVPPSAVHVDPQTMLCANWKVGQKFSVGFLVVELVAISNNRAIANISYIDPVNEINEIGVATFDLSGKYAGLLSLNGDGTVKGYQITLKMEAQ